MANPTVPNADQKSAINASAPNAKSVNVPDASDNAGKVNTQPVQNTNTQTQPAAQPAQHTNDQTRVGDVKKDDMKENTDVETSTSYSRMDDTEFKNQEAYARQFEKNVGEDSFRKAARLEREAQEAAAEGDPTRDPVAKQAAMDMNTPAPGAKRDAQKIKNIGEREAEKQAKRTGTN